jgi:hypothetical protein
MLNVVEIFRAFPFPSVFLILVPLVGGLASGLVGAYLGYDNLQERLESGRRNEHIETALDQLKLPVDTIRRYEAELSAAKQNTDLLKMIIRQYDQLRNSIAVQSRFTGHENLEDRITSADQIIENLRSLLGVTQTIPGPGGRALLIKTAPNTFRVLFAVPMRIAPRLDFHGLPNGVTANVLEKTNIGFTVTFTPQSIPVETFGFSADAEL